MTVVAPVRSREQQLSALRRANEIRVKRSALKRSLTCRGDAIAVLINPPEYAATMKVKDLLVAIPTVGSVKATRIMNHVRISYGKTVGGMSARQRGELARELGQ